MEARPMVVFLCHPRTGRLRQDSKEFKILVRVLKNQSKQTNKIQGPVRATEVKALATKPANPSSILETNHTVGGDITKRCIALSLNK